MDDFQHLIMKDQGPVTEVVLNRPEKRNALSLDLMTEVISAVGRATGSVIVIAGSGPCFSAGHDLAEMVGRSVADYRRLFDVCPRLPPARKTPRP